MNYNSRNQVITAEKGFKLFCLLNGEYYNTFCLNNKIFLNDKWETLTIEDFKEVERW